MNGYRIALLYPLFFSPALQAQVITLEELLADSGNAARVLQAEYELESTRHELERERADSGLRGFSSAGYGRTRDVIDHDRTRNFNAARARLGLSYPLLGRAEQDEREISQLSGQVAEKRLQQDAVRLLAGKEIANAYVTYWSAQESMVVVNAFLESEPQIRPRLETRREAQLLLESEYQELLLAYEQARNDASRYQLVQQESRQRLQLLTGRELEAFQARPGRMDAPATSATGDQLAGHPTLRLLESRGESLRQQLQASAWYGVDADLEVSTSVIRDTSGDQYGGDAYVGVNLSAPLSIMRVREKERKRLRLSMVAAEQEYRDQQQRLLIEAQQAWRRLQQGMQETELSRRKLESSALNLQERQLRGETFKEENVVRLVQAMQVYYRNALQDIEIRNATWQAAVDVRSLVEDVAQAGSGQQPAPADTASRGEVLARPLLLSVAVSEFRPAPPATAAYHTQPDAPRLIPAAQTTMEPAQDVAQDMAVYVWNSEHLLAPPPGADPWTEIQLLSINRLLLSLNRQQIDEAQSRPGKLRDFLDAAHARGMEVELLLGDPHWIEPAHRARLLGIISSLQAFDFDGLHLDIEPDQIYSQPLSREQYENWITTLSEAAAATSWPTSVDVHHRYLRESPYRDWDFAGRLQQNGVREIVLMIYNSNPAAVAEIARQSVSASPGMHFRIAQSVEPHLPQKLSHSGRSRDEFRESMRQLHGLMSAQPNVRGIVVQAWSDLTRMKHESQIY